MVASHQPQSDLELNNVTNGSEFITATEFMAEVVKS